MFDGVATCLDPGTGVIHGSQQANTKIAMSGITPQSLLVDAIVVTALQSGFPNRALMADRPMIGIAT
ncbi:MAG: hypothetical protein WC681_17635 [Sterolibacterium sp.]